MKQIKIIKISPEKGLEVKEISDDLKSLQTEVGGYITIANRSINKNAIAVVCDEEGKLKGKKVTAQSMSTSEMLVGNLIIASSRGGNLVSLSEKKIKLVKAAFVEHRNILAYD